MRAFVSTVTVLLVITFPCMEAIHGLYNFGQHEFFPKKNNCKPIPANFLLCHDIEYTEMRLPNLLGHETMNEVLQQASSWIPLVRRQCNPDTRKFLCSLFAPVCLDDLDEPIQPCRSLCESVKNGCEPVMSAFGFPWPSMLDCNRFPLDNDLCIPPAGMETFAPATGHGPEDGRRAGHHVSQAMAEGTAGVQEDYSQYPQAAVQRPGPLSPTQSTPFCSAIRSEIQNSDLEEGSL